MKGIVTVILSALLLFPGIAAAADRKTTPEPTGAAVTKGLTQKLDLNRVSLEQLVAVPGIGPRTAQAIVDLRSKKGSFKRMEDLLEVTGIKEKKLASIGGYLEVVPLQTAAPALPATQSK